MRLLYKGVEMPKPRLAKKSTLVSSAIWSDQFGHQWCCSGGGLHAWAPDKNDAYASWSWMWKLSMEGRSLVAPAHEIR
jgi:hypothetical protein